MLDDGSPSPPANKFSHSHQMEPIHESFYIQSVSKCPNEFTLNKQEYLHLGESSKSVLFVILNALLPFSVTHFAENYN